MRATPSPRLEDRLGFTATGSRGPCLRQASEQYSTRSQSRSHFFRHVNGRWHDTHVFGGGTLGRWIGGIGVLQSRSKVATSIANWCCQPEQD